MFETSVVQAHALAPRGRYRLLTISLAAHTAVIVGVLAMSIASTSFPVAAPDEYRQAPSFMPVRIPPPLGNPNGGGAKPQVTPAVKPPEQKPSQITAPVTVPETVTPVETPSTGTGDDSSANPTGSEPGPIGVPWGEPNSIGDLDAPPLTTTQPPVEEKVYTPGGEVKAPVLLRRVDPPYPQSLVRAGMPATVVVRCIIDRKGRVRDAQLIVPAMPPFNRAVLEAVQQWQYTPGSFRGVAVETYLEVTVHFSVRR